jgi:hypothetical protein
MPNFTASDRLANHDERGPGWEAGVVLTEDRPGMDVTRDARVLTEKVWRLHWPQLT